MSVKKTTVIINDNIESNAVNPICLAFPGDDLKSIDKIF